MNCCRGDAFRRPHVAHLAAVVAEPWQADARVDPGRRTRYVQPLALFLCTLFVMFMALTFMGGSPVTIQSPAGETAHSVNMDFDLGGLEKSQLFETFAKKLKNPDLALYKLQQTVYKFAFLLVPLSLPFMALLFVFRRGVTLYDHSVFILYSLTFMAILMMLMVAVSSLPAVGGVLFAACMVAVPVHMFAQLKGAYVLSWWGALWRTLVLVNFCAIVMVLFIFAAIYLGWGH